MFENIAKFFKKLVKSEQQETAKSKDTAKERLHLVLMQDRANVSTDFLELMKQEIIEVIKKYIDVEEEAIDVRLTNKVQEDGTNGAPFLYANIPIVKIKNEAKKEENKTENDKQTKSQIEDKKQEKYEDKKDETEKIEEVQEKKSEDIAKENDNVIEENKVEEQEDKSKNKEQNEKTEEKKEPTKKKTTKTTSKKK